MSTRLTMTSTVINATPTIPLRQPSQGRTQHCLTTRSPPGRLSKVDIIVGSHRKDSERQKSQFLNGILASLDNVNFGRWISRPRYRYGMRNCGATERSGQEHALKEARCLRRFVAIAPNGMSARLIELSYPDASGTVSQTRPGLRCIGVVGGAYVIAKLRMSSYKTTDSAGFPTPVARDVRALSSR